MLIGAFNKEKPLIGAFSVIVKLQSSRRFASSTRSYCLNVTLFCRGPLHRMSLISFSTLSTTTHWLSVPCFTFTCWANFSFTALAEKVQTVNYLMVSMPISIGSCFCSYILVSLPALLKSEAEVLNTSSILNQIFPPQQYFIYIYMTYCYSKN